MRAWIQVRTALLISLIACVWCLPMQGQQIGEDFNGRASSFGPTVSVASLRISEKAWRHFEKAKSLAEHNRLAESDVESLKAIAIAPDFAAAYLLRASAQVQERRFEAAVASIAEARRVEPDAEWSGVLLAGALNGLHRYDEAAAVLDGLHGPEAESWQAAYEHARAAIGIRDVNAALRWSDATLDAVPERFSDARLVRANALVLAHRWAEAASQMQSYLQSNGPQAHRAEVLAALPEIKRRARKEELQQVASR